MSSLRLRTTLIAFSRLSSAGLQIALAMMLVRLVDKSDYGTYQGVILAYMILAGFMNLDLGDSLLYFLPQSDLQERKKYIGQSVLLGVLSGAIIGAILYFSADLWGRANPRLAPLLKLFFLYPVFDQIYMLISLGFVAVDRPISAAAYTILGAVVKVASTILPVLIWGKLTALFVCLTVAWGATALIGLLWLGLAVGCSFVPMSSKRAGRQLSYVSPLLISRIIGSANIRLGNFLVMVLLGPVRLGEFTNGTYENPVVQIWTYSIGAAVMPDMVRAVQGGRLGEMLAYWKGAAAKGALVIFPVAAICGLCPDLLMKFLFTEKFLISALPFSIFLLVLPGRVVIYATALKALGRVMYVIHGAIISLAVNVVLSSSLMYLGRGSLLGFAGPAIGRVVATYFAAGYMTWKIAQLTERRVRDVLPLGRLVQIAKLSLIAAVPAAAGRFVPGPPVVKMLAIAAIFFPTYLLIGWKLRLFSESERELMGRMLRKLPFVPARQDSQT